MQEILSSLEIEQKINRLAHQLLENCFNEEQVFIGGISGNGSALSKDIAAIINQHDSIKVTTFEITVDKKEPWAVPIKMTLDKEELKNGFIVLVDDVLNSGKTMQYALVGLLQFPTKAIKTLALVDRKHRRFPIKANFVGLSLSTTLKNRVEVVYTDSEKKAYLV